MFVDIPSHLISAGEGIPQVCSRHGEQATQQRKVTFRSLAPSWTYLLIPFGLLLFLIVAFAVKKRVTAPAWPFCDRCRRLPTIRLLIGLGLVVIALAVLFGSFELTADASVPGPLFLLIIVALFAGLVTAGYATRGAVARGRVSNDGTTVAFRRPHPRFAEQVTALHQQAVAAQQGGAGQYTAEAQRLPHASS
ncbi:MAG TPA: hypothetical protein VFB74_13170 [Kribbellaceae bacterium]|nr:hypothetical protein [Kribbellaceae bacterium]